MQSETIFSEKGFTLIEVFVAMVILAFGVLAFIALQSSSIQARAHSQHLTNAVELTSSLLDELIVTDPNSLAEGSDMIALEGVNYNRSWTITSNNPASSLNRIRVITRWTEKDKNQSIELSAVVAQ